MLAVTPSAGAFETSPESGETRPVRQVGTDLTRVSQLTLLHPGQSEPRCHETISSFFFFWRLAHSGPLLWLSKGSHAQRIPLNMGALHCVTGGHIRGYKAHTPGGVKDTLHPL